MRRALSHSLFSWLGVLVLGLIGIFGSIACTVQASPRLMHDGPPPAMTAAEGADAENAKHGSENLSAGVYPRFTELVKEVSPAVVNISVESAESESDDPAAQHPFLRREPGTPYRSLGSGLIVHEDGHIVTNNHVIEKADKIIVRLLDDKTDYTATIVGKDVKTDLALLKIDAKKPLHASYIGDSDKLEVGEWVVAIGNQFQLGHTVSAGIVSALARKVRSGSPYDQYIQTDASINPGSSGGPLINTHGEVIGINTAIFSPGRSGGAGFNIGIGFAIPINLVRDIVEQLKDQGKVVRGMLGVIIQGIDADIASILKLDSADGALVADVVPDSPAEKAGFKRKDIITSFDGKRIRDYDDLPLMVASTAIGSRVSLEVLRDGSKKELHATISEMKDVPQKSDEQDSNAELDKPDVLGLIIKDVSEDIKRALGQNDLEGAMVISVEPSSPASKSGIERGDVIQELAGVTITNRQTYQSALKSVKKGKPALALVRRSVGTRFTVIKPSASSD